MTRAQIQCFLTVVDKMSITEAAKVLYVSQPAVSRRISQLEEELGTKLFSRDNARLMLTPAGIRAVEIFRDFENKIERFMQEAERTVDLSAARGTVRLGVADGWDISRWFGKITEVLKERYPDIKLELACQSHEELIRMLEKKEVDMVMDQKELFSGISGVRIHPIRKMKCILMYSKSHPLAGKNDLRLGDFRNYPFYVAVSKKAEIFILDMLQACLSEGFIPKVEYINSLSATYVKLLSENGVFFADEFLIAKDQERFAHILLPSERILCLGCRSGLSGACDAVEEVIIECSSEDLFEQSGC